MPLFSESDAEQFLAGHLKTARQIDTDEGGELANYMLRMSRTARVPLDLILEWVYSSRETVTAFDFSDWLKEGELPYARQQEYL